MAEISLFLPSESSEGKADGRRSSALRLLLLGLTLLAFSHGVIRLDAKDLWWDESLTLQRAEQPLLPLLVGRLDMHDGFTTAPTIDQHPFFYFLLVGGLLRVAGESIFVLRLVSAGAATLLAATAWSFSRLYVRRGVLPSTAPLWTVLFAAVSPFLLWYGQEARPYALWALLALLSTYLLLRATERTAEVHRGRRLPWTVGFVLVEVMFLTTHYYAVFLLPVHALLIVGALAGSRRSGLLWAVSLLVLGLAIGGWAYWLIIVRQGGGANFPFIDLDILLPDLLNAFALGLSVRIDAVWWLDLVFAAVMLIGAGWTLRSRAVLGAGGWVPAAMLGVPILLLLAINLFYPAYMNARHMSLLAGPYLVLLGAGLGLLWTRRRAMTAALAILLLAGIGLSSSNYYRLEEYAKDDYSTLSEFMRQRILPGDLVLIKPPFSWRIFSYYLPLDAVDAAEAAGVSIAQRGVPLLNAAWPETAAALESLTSAYRRIWLVSSGTHPYLDPDNQVERWLSEQLVQIQETQFFSQSSLKARLYLPEGPARPDVPDEITAPVDVTFGDRLRLAGFDLGPDAGAELALPVTLYWQVNEKPTARYKYILRLVEGGEDDHRLLAMAEREPYEGAIPTTFWDPGITIEEIGWLPPVDLSAVRGPLLLTLQIYDAATLQKLSVTANPHGLPMPDGETVVLPVPAEWGDAE